MLKKKMTYNSKEEFIEYWCFNFQTELNSQFWLNDVFVHFYIKSSLKSLILRSPSKQVWDIRLFQKILYFFTYNDTS